MSERAPLLALLRKVRRRLRVLAAVDGAVLGAVLGLAALTFPIAILRLGGWYFVSVPLGAMIVGAVALGGAFVLAVQPIAMDASARLVDRALDGQDRVLSALWLLDQPGSALARATVTDAVDRARALSPSLLVPARRPRRLGALGVAALAVAASMAIPAIAPAARLDAAAARPAVAADPALKLALNRLQAEREEAHKAAEEAKVLGDDELRTVARDFDATIKALTDGELTRGDALDRLKELAERAAEAGKQAEGRREAVHEAGRALQENASTRAAGAALAADDVAASERALGALAARAAEASASERNQVARAFDAAAQRAGAAGVGATGDSPAGGESSRRLKRDGAGSTPSAGGGDRAQPGDRHLERLRRDLADTASACRDNPEACRQRLSQRAGDLPRMAQESRRVNVWKRVEGAVRQMRDRLRRGDLGGREGQQQAQRRSGRGSKGQGDKAGQSGDDGRAMVEGDGDGDDYLEQEGGGGGTFIEMEGGASALEDGARSGSGDSKSSPDTQSSPGGQGDGIGNQPGAEPLGKNTLSGTPQANSREARVKGGAGPTRSQVIESAAQKGFAHGAYDRVFSDYHAVVEEALEAGAVPEGRRYMVRRYFQLIRPRTSEPPARPAP